MLHLQEPQLRRLSKLWFMRSLTIYGGGPSLRLADFSADCDKWSVGSLFPVLGDKMDLYFCLHPDEKVHHISVLEDVGYIDQSRYPLEKIIKKYGSKYFTNSISYMIAYAMYKGYKEIHIVGVDVEKYSEWVYERPSIAYWCGRAEQKGINVYWGKLRPCFLYGFEQEEMQKVLIILNRKIENGKKEFELAKDQRIKDQWAGYIHGLEQMVQEITS